MKEINRVVHTLTKAVILILLLSFTACVETPDDLLDPDTAGVWTLYNSQNSGLPGNTVADMEIDISGNLWISCPGNGIAKLSEGKWTEYNTSNSGLLSNDVTAIESTANGSIIVGTINGIAKLDPSGIWTSYKDPLVTTMEVNIVRSTSDGALWIGTYNEGLYISDESVVSHPTSGLTVFSFEEDKSGNIWMGTNNGLLRWNGLTWTNITNTEGLPAGSVKSLFIDRKDRIWIGVYNADKVYWRDNSGVHALSLMTGLAGNDIRDICEDQKGDQWFATYGGGLVRYDGVVPHSYKDYNVVFGNEINSRFENNVNCIVNDNDGNIWFGLASKGLVKYSLPIE